MGARAIFTLMAAASKSSGSPSSSVTVQALAGGVGSTIALLITYPLYTVTLRLQAQHSKQTQSQSAEQSSSPSTRSDDTNGGPNQYAGGTTLSHKPLLETVRDIVREEGVGALYNGCGAGLFAVSVQSAVFYAFYRVFDSSEGSQSAWRSLGAAFAAGCSTVCCTHPLWVVNYKLTTMRAPKAPPPTTTSNATEVRASRPIGFARQWWHCVRSLWREDGIRGIYAGVLPALVLCVNPAILFWAYEVLRRVRQAVRSKLQATPQALGAPLSDVEAFLLGGLSKLFSTVLTYPMQTVKTALSKAATKVDGRKGTEEDTGDLGERDAEFAGVVDAVQCILRHAGWTGFYHGLSTKLLQTTLTAAFTFLLRLRLVALLRRVV